MLSPSKRGESSLSASTAITESSLPLRIALGTLLIKVFPLHPDGHAYSEEDAIYSHIFTSTILRIVAREILELATPATYISLLRETDPLIKTEIKRLDHRIERKRQRGEHYDHLDPFLEFESWLGQFSSTFSDPCDGCEYIRQMEKDLYGLYGEDEEGTDLSVIPKPIEHQSVIGIFVRDLLLILRKMSFEESITLSRLMGIWCGANVPSTTRPLHIYSLNRKTAMEDTFRKRQDALQRYTSASASGDHTKALHALRQFYDYQFPANLRGQHQHALLGLATFHYSTGGVEVARTAVNESIRVARAEGDKQCLQKCLSLLRRLDLEASPASSGGPEGLRISQAPIPASKLSPATSANDELWSIKPALDLGEPIHVALGRVHRALGRYETSIAPSEESKELVPPDELDMAAWHSTQAALWSSLGSNTLCNLHMNMASRHASNPTARLTVALSKAERAADQAEYDKSLSILLDMNLLDGMTIADYQRWSEVLFVILRRRANMRGNEDALMVLRHLDGGPSTPFHSSELSGEGVKSVYDHVRLSLKKAKKLVESNSPSHLILPLILSCTELTMSLGLWPMYRLSIVLLSHVFISAESGLAHKALSEVESVWAQVLESGDEETICLAALAMGKANVELGLDKQSEVLLSKARHDVETALVAARKLESTSLIQECLTILSLLADLAVSDDRDDLAEEWASSYRTDQTDFKGDLQTIGEIVKLVGVRVIEGWDMT